MAREPRYVLHCSSELYETLAVVLQCKASQTLHDPRDETLGSEYQELGLLELEVVAWIRSFGPSTW
jgi:hypothetical protein